MARIATDDEEYFCSADSAEQKVSSQRIFDLMKHEIEKSFARQAVSSNSLLGCVLPKNGLNESRGPSKIENHPSGCDRFSSAVSAEEKICGHPGHLW
jgi:hypothetical protein